MTSGISETLSTVFSWAGDGVGSTLMTLFSYVFYRLCSALCWIIGILSRFFSVMSGMTKVRYAGKAETLMDVFFGNTVVENLYWAMALIGILLCFVFAIIAVARKAVDAGDKMRQSMGDILTGMFKGILIIICLTFVISVVLAFSDKLMTQINYAFDRSDTLGKEDSIEFTDEQYAAMARVLDTIGNYSLNPSYNSRYNLNSCFNEIRGDLQYLVQQGVFDFYYVTDSEDAKESWQSALQKIVNSADLNQDLAFDVYNKSVSDALLACMETLQTDYSFSPLKSYTRQYTRTSSDTALDKMVFLIGTMRAAKNSVYNENPTLEDPLRGAYYADEKSIYDYNQVSADFDLNSIDYIVIILVACKLIWDLTVITFDCVARVFNMVFLYLIAPPFIGVMPFDEGGKFKQWTTAFVVQCFGVFGTVIAMRVLLIFIPIIVDSDLVLFESSLLNWLAKLLLILAGMSTAKRANSVITGILANNAGMQAISGGNLGDSVRASMNHLRNRVTGFGSVGEMARNRDSGPAPRSDRTPNAPAQQKAPGGAKDSGPSLSPQRHLPDIEAPSIPPHGEHEAEEAALPQNNNPLAGAPGGVDNAPQPEIPAVPAAVQQPEAVQPEAVQPEVPQPVIQQQGDADQGQVDPNVVAVAQSILNLPHIQQYYQNRQAPPMEDDVE